MIKLAPIFKFCWVGCGSGQYGCRFGLPKKQLSYLSRYFRRCQCRRFAPAAAGSRRKPAFCRAAEIDEQEQKAGAPRRELLGYQELLEEHEHLKFINNKLVELRTCNRRKSAQS
ncbi:MAG: hypothetical protein ACLR2G_07290 [Phascolarctobacterium faecium]